MRHVLLDPDLQPDPRGLTLLGAALTGVLDLQAAHLPCPLNLQRCHLEKAPNFADATIPALNLERSHLPGLTLTGARIGAGASLERLTATGPIRAIGAHIGGQLNLHRARLTNPDGITLSLDGARIDGGARLDELTATGQVRANGAHISGPLMLRGATLTNPHGAALSLDQAHVDGGAFLDKLAATGQVDAVDAHIAGQLGLQGATLTNPNGIALGLAGPLTIDIDSTIVEVHGRAKQGAAFGYTKVRGYHPQLATCAQTGQVLMCRLRGGAAGAARGAASFLTETISRVRGAGATGQLTVRADSAFYSKTVLSTAAKLGVRFSVTVRQDKKVKAAIEAIDEQAWQPIPYWLSTPEVSGADIAETAYTCLAGAKRHARTVRLVVRRVRPTPGSQLALFTTWDYHAFVTDRDLPLPEVEADHRRHAVVEQSIAELKSAGLAHLPSDKFMANAAWLALAVMAHNLGRAVGALVGPELDTATAATLRRQLFTMPGRLVHTGRRRHLRLPASWPWADPVLHALGRIHAIPLRC